MEFKTSQGGETTLVFDPHEENDLADLAVRLQAPVADIKHKLVLTRQANPLAGFTELIGLAFGRHTAGLAPAKPVRRKAEPAPDPVAMLIEDIRRRLAAITSVSVGQTSASAQTEAMLLQALATCLQTQALASLIRDIYACVDAIEKAR